MSFSERERCQLDGASKGKKENQRERESTVDVDWFDEGGDSDLNPVDFSDY